MMHVYTSIEHVPVVKGETGVNSKHPHVQPFKFRLNAYIPVDAVLC